MSDVPVKYFGGVLIVLKIFPSGSPLSVFVPCSICTTIACLYHGLFFLQSYVK
jgi:hypothetical protein